MMRAAGVIQGRQSTHDGPTFLADDVSEGAHGYREKAVPLDDRERAWPPSSNITEQRLAVNTKMAQQRVKPKPMWQYLTSAI